jgi:signal peptidase II
MVIRLGYGLVALAVLSLDQVTKALAVSSLALGESTPVVPGCLHFTLVRNSGMAFGLLGAWSVPYKAALVTLLSLGALTAVAVYALRSPVHEHWSQAGLALILGGAAGNIVDRLRLGYVVDFVDAFYGDAHWPAFNLADAAICGGVGMLLLESLRRPRRLDSHRPLGTECTRNSSTSES